MNTEYVWWLVVLLLVGAGVVAYLAVGPVPEIGPEAPTTAPDGTPIAGSTGPGVGAAAAEDAQSLAVRTTVPGSDEPDWTHDTP